MIKKNFIISIIGILSLTGYSSHANNVKEEYIKLESVDSGNVNITQVYLQHSEKTFVLRGELKSHFIKPFPKRFFIPGHLDVELVDVDGDVLKRLSLGYKRKPTRTGFAKFYLPITDDIEQISTIRVIHHETSSHITNGS
jgi:hypothetical protein